MGHLSGVLGVVTLVLISEFPLPTDRPSASVRIAAGKVKSVDTIDRLFSGSHTWGELAAQPVNVVGAEFVPEGRLEPVLAVDLIDEGSLVLKPGAIVGLEYELAAPRTAHLQGATRNFPRRNLADIAIMLCVYGALLLGVPFGAHYLGRGWKRLLQKPNKRRDSWRRTIRKLENLCAFLQGLFSSIVHESGLTHV